MHSSNTLAITLALFIIHVATTYYKTHYAVIAAKYTLLTPGNDKWKENINTNYSKTLCGI